jgi:anti-anti-sigma regulatory factor/HAMP domain-containing protein
MAIATVTVSTTIVVGSLAYWISREALEKASFNQLVSVRELKADQVDNFFSTIRNQVVALSANRMVIDAMKSFHDAFGSGSMSDQMEDTAVLRAFYGEEFMARAREAQAPVDNVVDLWPADPRSQQMQHLYLAANPFPVGEKYQLERSPDGSRYADMHATFHPFLRDFSKRFGFYDLFLVDAKSGYIVYSVEKEIDFATSLLDGPYRDSNIAKVFREARHSNNANFVLMVDFESYMPSYGAQASFLASPIFNGNEITGVLIVQVPLDRLNHIMTSGEVWSDVGLGETGETYVVGPDFKVRTEPRFLVSDPESFFNDIAAAGIESTTRDRMRSLGSALPDVDSAIMSEMDQAEAFAEVRLLRNLTAAMLLATAIVAMGLAWWIARNLVAPLRTLRDSANRLSAGDLEVKLGIDRGDEIGELATSFEQMRRSIQDLIQRQEASIDALATPLIPFRKEILIVPMVGLVDQTRIDKLRESLIEQVHQQGSRAVIIDLTGVPDMDATIVERLNVVTGAASLLGAAVVLTGLRPEIAQQWARQEAEIHNAVSERSLERGIARALEIANTRSDNGTRE